MTRKKTRGGDTQRSRHLADIVAQAALEKKAEDVVILDLSKLDTLTDFFVICSGEVDQHVRAIADNIADRVKKTTGDRLLHREGREALNWVLLDYVDVVVHVFKPAFREYYRLEDLWSDAESYRVSDSGGTERKPAAKRTALKPAKPQRKNVEAPKRAAAGAAKKAAAKPKPAEKKSPEKKSPAKVVRPAAKPKVAPAKKRKPASKC